MPKIQMPLNVELEDQQRYYALKERLGLTHPQLFKAMLDAYEAQERGDDDA